jgi:hypothetical protein
MSKFKVGNPWKTGKTNSERRGIWATGQKALKRRDNGVLSRKTESVMKSKGYRNPANKNQETPEGGLCRSTEISP